MNYGNIWMFYALCSQNVLHKNWGLIQRWLLGARVGITVEAAWIRCILFCLWKTLCWFFFSCFCFFPSLCAGILVNEHGVPEEEENFDEAIKAVNTALVPTRVTHLHCESNFVQINRRYSYVITSAPLMYQKKKKTSIVDVPNLFSWKLDLWACMNFAFFAGK